MPRLTKDSVVTVGTKDYKIEDLLKTIIYLPADQIKTFFMELGLKIPRELRMFVLREVLRSKVIETRKSRLTLADELNYRLSWYTEFTETQLENLLVFFDDHKIYRDFLEDFWTDLIAYMIEKEVSPKELKHLLDDSLVHVKKVGLELPEMKTYNRDIKDLFFDSFGRIDGLAPAKFRPVLFKSSTLTEVRDLGSKYDVQVPRRLKKTELAEIIIKELKDRGQHTEKLEEEIRGMSVLVMQRFAIDHDIKASTELKKEEIIEYILANAKETKETYFVPESQGDYDKEIYEVADDYVEEDLTLEPEVVIEEPQPVEQPTPEPEPEPEVEEEKAIEEEPVKEAVKEPEVKPEPKVQVVQSTIDISELVAEIKKLREAVENILSPVEDDRYEVEDTSETQQISTNHIDSDVPMPDHSTVILNSAEFYGKPKSLKKIIKNDEADERERFIEEKKAASTIGTGKDEDVDQLPGELRFFGKVFKGIGKGLFKIFKVLLKIALIVAVIGIVVLLIYAALTYFVTTLTFLDGFNNTLNGIQIGGVGLLDRIHAIFASLGL